MRLKVKSMSELVKGAPSCHWTLGLSFQVTSIDPSGLSRQVPLSADTPCAASCGWYTPCSSCAVRELWTMARIKPEPRFAFVPVYP